LGIRGQIDYEAQAAVELEMAAYDGKDDGAYPFTVDIQGGIRVIGLRELFSEIVSDLSRGVPTYAISNRFHNTVAQMISLVCSQIAEETSIDRVVLSGGVFQNRLLMNKVIAALDAAGLISITHSQVPCNDGGIALGQAVIANSVSQRR